MLILYAEDDIDDFDFFCEVVKGATPEATCVNVRNGVETMDYLNDCSVLPDIIFLDINMPGMDGKACLREIKKHSRFSQIRVIVYSTSNHKFDQEQCLQLGASAFINKPVNMKDAVEKISSVL